MSWLLLVQIDENGFEEDPCLADGYCLWFMIRRLVVWHIVPRALKITNLKKNRFDFFDEMKKFQSPEEPFIGPDQK